MDRFLFRRRHSPSKTGIVQLNILDEGIECNQMFGIICLHASRSASNQMGRVRENDLW